MKFAHLADCHVGGWREPKLRDLNTRSFINAIDICIQENVDFVLIAGDLFNTSLPAMDCLKVVVQKFKELNDKNISIYLIAGSHDFSPSGKTILDVLESAGLFINVTKGEVIDGKLKLDFTIDKKTGAKITGMLGKKGGLDKYYYYDLIKDDLEQEQGFKIFMFHCAINELKPKELQDMDAVGISLLPKSFDYYAGGHVHITEDISIEGYKNVVYPGPVFPNNFSELEKLGCGSFCIYDNNIIKRIKIELNQVKIITLNCENKSSKQVQELLLKESENDFMDKIVLIRLFGCLSQGKPSDIDFSQIFSKIYNNGAYFVMKNTNQLISKEFEEIKVSKNTVEEIEDSLIKEHSGQSKLFDPVKEQELNKKLMIALSIEKDEGERINDFEQRIKQEVDKIIEL